MKILMIIIFGSLGVLTRYGLDTLLGSINNHYPFTTLLANSIGCFLIGVLACFLLKENNPVLISAIMIGFCGGLTTFSSFSLQSLELIQNDQLLKAFTYLIVSPLIGIICVIIGLKFGKIIA